MLVDDRLVAEHREEIIQIYYHQFRETLKDIGYRSQIPSMHELKVKILKVLKISFVLTLKSF